MLAVKLKVCAIKPRFVVSFLHLKKHSSKNGNNRCFASEDSQLPLLVWKGGVSLWVFWYNTQDSRTCTFVHLCACSLSWTYTYTVSTNSLYKPHRNKKNQMHFSFPCSVCCTNNWKFLTERGSEVLLVPERALGSMKWHKTLLFIPKQYMLHKYDAMVHP